MLIRYFVWEVELNGSKIWLSNGILCLTHDDMLFNVNVTAGVDV